MTCIPIKYKNMNSKKSLQKIVIQNRFNLKGRQP